MLQRYDWPINPSRPLAEVSLVFGRFDLQSIELGHHSLDPRHQKRKLARDTIDSDRICGINPQVGLVKHVGVVMQSEQVANIRVFLQCKEI